MRLRGIKRSFTGGEVAETIISRDDLSKYASSCKVMQNFVPQLHGLARFRNGTRFVAELPAGPRLIPFVFNNEPEDRYVLCFSNNELRIAQGDGLVVKDGAPLVVNTTLPTADIKDISYAQSGDIVYLAHRNHNPPKLSRKSHTDWTFENVVFETALQAPASLTGTWHYPKPPTDPDEPAPDYDHDLDTYTLEYAVCAVNEKGELSLPVKTSIANARYITEWVVGNHATLAWPVVAGATEYNIYRSQGGYFGLIGVSETNSFDDQNYEADTSNTIPVKHNPFEDDNNPSVVAFHQQRLAYAGGNKNPQTFWMSQTGNFENFNKSHPVRNDDSLEFVIYSGTINEIQWIAPLGDLLIGTAGAEYMASGGGEGKAITPVDLYVRTQSYWGSRNLPPLIIGNSVVHLGRQGTRVSDLYYDLASSGYKGNDLSILAAHLFQNHVITSWCYQQAPDSIIWSVRDDGVLLALTYLKEHQIWGWSRHVTDGEVTQVCCLPGTDNDDVYIVVKRNVDGTDRFYLERLIPYWHASDGIEEAIYLDCSASYTFDTPQSTVDGLEHLEGKSVRALVDGQSTGSFTVTDGSIELGRDGSRVHVGLSYEGIVAPLPFEADIQGQTTQGQKRQTGRTVLRVYESLGGSISVNGKDYDALPDIPPRYGDPLTPYTGDINAQAPAGSEVDSTIWVRQTLPLPMNILSIIAEVSIG